MTDRELTKVRRLSSPFGSFAGWSLASLAGFGQCLGGLGNGRIKEPGGRVPSAGQRYRRVSRTGFMVYEIGFGGNELRPDDYELAIAMSTT